MWNDVSGNGYDSTPTNGPTFTSYQSGGYFNFDGVDDISAAPTTPSSLQGNLNLTVCGFFRRTGNFSSKGPWGIGGESTDGGICSWNAGNTNEITIDTWNRGTFTTGRTYPLNGWVFVAWQKVAGTMTRANCTIWVNLTSYTNTQLTILRAEGPAPNINNYGYTLGSISRTTGFCTPMQIGNFYVYNRVLSSAEIAQNFNAQRNRFGI